MDYENYIFMKDYARNYLALMGIEHSSNDISKLIALYKDDQEWNGNIMTTGNSVDEIKTWIEEKADYIKENNIESFDEFFDSLEYDEIERDWL